MNRRRFIAGLLCAPALVRASSLDALPRGLGLYGTGANNWFRTGVQHIDLVDCQEGDLVLALVRRVHRETGEVVWNVVQTHKRLDSDLVDAKD